MKRVSSPPPLLLLVLVLTTRDKSRVACIIFSFFARHVHHVVDEDVVCRRSSSSRCRRRRRGPRSRIELSRRRRRRFETYERALPHERQPRRTDARSNRRDGIPSSAPAQPRAPRETRHQLCSDLCALAAVHTLEVEHVHREGGFLGPGGTRRSERRSEAAGVCACRCRGSWLYSTLL